MPRVKRVTAAGRNVIIVVGREILLQEVKVMLQKVDVIAAGRSIVPSGRRIIAAGGKATTRLTAKPESSPRVEMALP